MINYNNRLLNMFISKTVSEEVKKLHKYCLEWQKK